MFVLVWHGIGLGVDGVQMLKLYLEWSFSLPLWCLLRQPVLEGAQSVLGVIITMIQTQVSTHRYTDTHIHTHTHTHTYTHTHTLSLSLSHTDSRHTDSRHILRHRCRGRDRDGRRDR
jgi:hypothetical protein